MISRFFKSINNLPFYFKYPSYLFLLIVLFYISITLLILLHNTVYDILLYDRLRINNDYSYIKKEDWRETASGRFAHNLEYEDKLAKPVPFKFNRFAKFEDESARYFEHLCATEGKEYIYKTADNVTSVAQLRSFEYQKNAGVGIEEKKQGPVTRYRLYPYGLEAPLFFDENRRSPYYKLHINELNAIKDKDFGAIYRLPYYHYEILFNNGEIYDYYYDKKENEERVKKDPQFTYDKILKAEKKDKLNSRYGWTWRGFSREKDRDLGIAGGDMIIIDLETNEIMAVQRSFVKAFVHIPQQRLNWGGIGCFEQYKNSWLHENDKFEGKNFKEKRKTIRSQETTMGILAPFLHKVLKPEDKVLTSYAGDKIYPNKPKTKTQE